MSTPGTLSRVWGRTWHSVRSTWLARAMTAARRGEPAQLRGAIGELNIEVEAEERQVFQDGRFLTGRQVQPVGWASLIRRVPDPEIGDDPALDRAKKTPRIRSGRQAQDVVGAQVVEELRGSGAEHLHAPRCDRSNRAPCSRAWRYAAWLRDAISDMVTRRCGFAFCEHLPAPGTCCRRSVVGPGRRSPGGGRTVAPRPPPATR